MEKSYRVGRFKKGSRGIDPNWVGVQVLIPVMQANGTGDRVDVRPFTERFVGMDHGVDRKALHIYDNCVKDSREAIVIYGKQKMGEQGGY